MTRDLKSLARSLQAPVVLLCQLNRQIESRADRRPQLSDLRESGAIEQDADDVVVVFIDRPAMYDDKADETEARLFIRKQRNGPTGEIRLDWHGETYQFCDHIPHQTGLQS